MSTDQVIVTDRGLLSLNRKIINERKFSSQLISTVGTLSVIESIASNFNKESYIYKSELLFPSDNLSISFQGTYMTSEERSIQTAWYLSGANNKTIIFQFTEDSIPQLILPSGDILSFDYLHIPDDTQIRIITNLTSTTCKVTLVIDNQSFAEEGTLANALDLSVFNYFALGNNPLNTSSSDSYFWLGSINLQKVAINSNTGMIYSPTNGYSFEIKEIVISDGKYPLSDTPFSRSRHSYRYHVDTITSSANTLLISTILGEDSQLIIREIGIYATETIDGVATTYLFGYINNLNINKGADIPYDLILTVNLAVNIVNVIGFPDQNSFIFETIVPALLKNYVTVKNANAWLIGCLERIIRMNSLQPIKTAGYIGRTLKVTHNDEPPAFHVNYEGGIGCCGYEVVNGEKVPVSPDGNMRIPAQCPSIGYRTDQLVYRVQKDIAEQKDCYSSVQTYSKLKKKLKYKSEFIFNEDSVLPYGYLEIPESGIATQFSDSDFLSINHSIEMDNNWELKVAFSVRTVFADNRCFLTLGELIFDEESEETSFTKFLTLGVSDNGYLMIGSTNTSQNIALNTMYYVKLSYNASQPNSLSISISKDDETYTLVSQETGLPTVESLTNIVMGVNETVGNEGSIISDPFINGTIYLMKCEIQQKNNMWSPISERVLQGVDLLQYYHLPTYPKLSYRLLDLNNFNYYIDVYDEYYKGNEDLIDFSRNQLSLCFKVSLQADDQLFAYQYKEGNTYKYIYLLNHKTATSTEDVLYDTNFTPSNNPDFSIREEDGSYNIYYKDTLATYNRNQNKTGIASPKLLIAKTNSNNDVLFKLELIQGLDYQNNIASFLQFTLTTTTGEQVISTPPISPAGLDEYMGNEFLLTIIKDNDNLSMYRNNELIVANNNSDTVVPTYEGSYITNNLSQVSKAGKYIKDIIVAKGALSEGQLYYITNLTDTNFGFTMNDNQLD